MTDQEIIEYLQPRADAGGTNQNATMTLRCAELRQVLTLAREALAVEDALAVEEATHPVGVDADPNLKQTTFIPNSQRTRNPNRR